MKPFALSTVPVGRLRPTAIPDHLLTGTPATAAVWRPDPARNGEGNCHHCRGTGDAQRGGILFCDRCGGTGTFGPGPQRVKGPDGQFVTLYGPVPQWLQSAIATGEVPASAS